MKYYVICNWQDHGAEFTDWGEAADYVRELRAKGEDPRIVGGPDCLEPEEGWVGVPDAETA
jgi:hypothetical protein